jgi:hypothetical protein
MSTEEQYKTPNEGDEIETLLRGLNKVNAPGDFDLRLRARIANHSEGYKQFSFGFLRFAAPATLVLLAGFAGYFVLTGGSSIEPPAGSSFVAQQMPEVEESIAPPAAPAATPLIQERSNETAIVSMPGKTTRPVSRPATTLNRSRPVLVTTGGGSEDRAATAPDATIFPPGLTPDQPVDAVPPSPQGATDISVPNVLALLGVRAVYGDGGWRVVAAESNGAADRSGVRVGDIIVSLGATVLGERTSFKAPANIESLRVRRDGTEIELKLGR